MQTCPPVITSQTYTHIVLGIDVPWLCFSQKFTERLRNKQWLSFFRLIMECGGYFRTRSWALGMGCHNRDSPLWAKIQQRLYPSQYCPPNILRFINASDKIKDIFFFRFCRAFWKYPLFLSEVFIDPYNMQYFLRGRYLLDHPIVCGWLE